MTVETMKAAVAILEGQGESVTLEYPGMITLERSGRIYVFGDANEDFGGDAYASAQAFELGAAPDLVTTPLRSDHEDPVAVAQAITEAVREHQKQCPEMFYVFNETDGILASPEPMTRVECDRFMLQFRMRFAGQGYYASASGRIPLADLRLKRIPEAEL
jgi:hypothetical protein